MIVKILSRSSPNAIQGVITYILREDTTKEHEEPLIFTKNLRSQDINGYIEEYKINEGFRITQRKDSVYMLHTILSASPDELQENTTPEKLQMLFDRFTELWGKDGIHLAKVHYDTNSIHLHIATSPIEYRTGQSLRLSHQELKTLKTELQRFQIEKDIWPLSIVDHGSGKEYVNDRQYFHRKTNAEREAIQQQLQECYKKATSQSHFISLLSELDIHSYERGANHAGIMIGERKHRWNQFDIDYKDLPVDPKLSIQEQQVLSEIQAIRQTTRSRYIDIPGRDISK